MGSITLGSAQALVDYRGRAQNVIDTYLPLEWVMMEDNNYHHAYIPHLYAPQYSKPPALKPNMAYWPTGATRWAYGYLLMSGAQADLVQSNSPATLAVTGGRWSLSRTVWPLQSHQILEADGKPNGGLWIIPWVDERYWWQHQEIQFSVTSTTTWADLLNACAAALNITLNAYTIPAVFKNPSFGFNAKLLSAAVAFDAAAQGLQARVVPKWDGTYSLESHTEAETVYQANITRDQSYNITGASSKAMPRATYVDVAHDVALQGLKCPHKPQYISRYIAKGGNRITSPIHETLIYSTMAALWSAPSGPDPGNKVSLDDLSSELGGRLEGWKNRFYRLGYNGMQEWDLCGFDNAIVFQFGTEDNWQEVSQPDTDQAATLEDNWRPVSYTHVLSYGHNYHYPWNYSIEAQIYEENEGVLIKLTEDLLPGGEAAGVIVNYAGGWQTSDTVKVIDYHRTGDTAAHGATCALTDEVIWGQTYRNPSTPDDITTCHPYSRHSHGLSRVVTLQSDLALGLIGNANIVRTYGTSGPQIAVRNYTNQTLTAPGPYGAYWVSTAREWAVVGLSAQQPSTGARMIQFSLLGDLTLAQASVQATRTFVWAGDDPGATVTVYNTCQNFFGDAGICGAAAYNEAQSRWQIILLWEQQARFIEFTVTTAFTGADDTITATTNFYYDGTNPGQPTIWNTGNAFSGNVGAKGLARYDFNRGRYQAVYVVPPDSPAGDAVQWMTFKTTVAFPHTSAQVTVNRVDWWNGPDPGAGLIFVENTQLRFYGVRANLEGIAAKSSRDNKWYIVAIYNPPTSWQRAEGIIRNIQYGNVAENIRFDTVTGNGDLIGIEPDPGQSYGDIKFIRGARGAVYVRVQASWLGQKLTQAGVTEFTKVRIWRNVGTGWEDITPGVAGDGIRVAHMADNVLNAASQTEPWRLPVQLNYVYAFPNVGENANDLLRVSVETNGATPIPAADGPTVLVDVWEDEQYFRLMT